MLAHRPFTTGPASPGNTQQTQNICITFIQRRPNVFDVGPTWYKCYANVLCLPGNNSVTLNLPVAILVPDQMQQTSAPVTGRTRLLSFQHLLIPSQY